MRQPGWDEPLSAMELAMSPSTSMFDALGQRVGHASTAPVHSTYTSANTQRPVSQSYPSRQSHGGQARAPLNHPVADKLLGQSIPVQVKLVIVDRCHFLGEFPSRRVLEHRCEVIVTVYNELQGMGFSIRDVTSFGLKHARALLELWKSRDLAKKTIYNRWSALRGWSIALGKHGMLGTIDEYWPEFSVPSTPTAGYRVLTAEQLRERSDFLGKQGDKTACLVDRLARDAGMSREDALEMEFSAAQGIAHGHDVLRCGNGASVRTYKGMGQHQALMKEAADFMSSRKRSKLGWPGLSSQDAIAKYSVRLSYVTRCLFPKDDKVAQESKGGQSK